MLTDTDVGKSFKSEIPSNSILRVREMAGLRRRLADLLEFILPLFRASNYLETLQNWGAGKNNRERGKLSEWINVELSLLCYM